MQGQFWNKLQFAYVRNIITDSNVTHVAIGTWMTLNDVEWRDGTEVKQSARSWSRRLFFNFPFTRLIYRNTPFCERNACGFMIESVVVSDLDCLNKDGWYHVQVFSFLSRAGNRQKSVKIWQKFVISDVRIEIIFTPYNNIFHYSNI